MKVKLIGYDGDYTYIVPEEYFGEIDTLEVYDAKTAIGDNIVAVMKDGRRLSVMPARLGEGDDST